MKIVVLDGHGLNPGDLDYGLYSQLGEVDLYDYGPETTEDLIARIAGHEIVVTNKINLTREILVRCPGVRLICVTATGYNIVDTAAAKELGIPVCNVPAYGTEMVAQFAIGLLLELCHHTWDHSRSVHAGDWEKCPDFCYWNYPIIELKNKTIGIIGFGRIGRQVGRVAKALGMRVLATGSRPCPEGLEIGKYVALDSLLAQSDVISLHCPLFPETTKMINAETIAKMKDGVILINNSRGGLLDEQAVADALRSGKISAAGVDVVTEEPILGSNPLLSAPNCIITPHISWAATECRQRVLQITIDNISGFLAGTPQNVVNS